MYNSPWLNIPIMVVIGVFSGLAVQPVQRWLENRGKAARSARTERIVTEYEHVMFFLTHPELFAPRLLIDFYMILIAGLSVILGSTLALSPVKELIYRLPPAPARWAFPMLLMSGLCYIGFVIFWVVLASRKLLSYIDMFNRLVTPKEYFETVPNEIRDLDEERFVILKRESTMADDPPRIPPNGDDL